MTDIVVASKTKEALPADFLEELRKHDPVSTAQQAIIQLHVISKKKHSEWGGFLPWELHLIIKWVLAFGDYNCPYQCTKQGLIAKLSKLQGLRAVRETDPLLKLKNPIKFMRKVVCQQHGLMRDIDGCFVARQNLMLIHSDLAKAKEFRELFQRRTSLTVKEFNQLLFVLYAYSAGKKMLVRFCLSDLSRLFAAFPKKMIQDFLNMIAFDIRTVCYPCRAGSKRSLEEQYYEQSIFLRRPILIIGDEYWIISPYLIREGFRKLALMLVDEELGANKSVNELFGPCFENYVAKVLENINCDILLREGDIRKRYSLSKHASSPDFLIRQHGVELIIEAKGTQLRDDVKVSQTDTRLAETLKNTLVKGIKQCYELANNPTRKANAKNAKLFSMVVTYEDTYLMTGHHAYEEFAKDEIDKFLQKRGFTKTSLDLTKVFICSIEGLEFFIALMQGNGFNLKTTLELISTKYKSDPSLSFSTALQKEFSPNPAKLQLFSRAFTAFADEIVEKCTSIAGPEEVRLVQPVNVGIWVPKYNR